MSLFEWTTPEPPRAASRPGNGAQAARPKIPTLDGDVVHGLFDHGVGYKVSRKLFERIEKPLDELCTQLARCGCFNIEIIDDGDRVRIEYGMSTLDLLEISKGDPDAFISIHGMKFVAGVTRRLEPAVLTEAMTRWNKLAKNSPAGLLLMAFRATRILRRYQVVELNHLDCGINIQLELDSDAVQKLLTSPVEIVVALEDAAKWIRNSYKEHRQRTVR
jgi:hypothetical protein